MVYRKRGKLEASVNAALSVKPPTDRDRAVADLALTYARRIDAHPDELWRYGPRLLDALESLQMSPRTRAAVLGEGVTAPHASPVKPAASRLDQLRDRRARKNRAPDLDPSAAGPV